MSRKRKLSASTAGGEKDHHHCGGNMHHLPVKDELFFQHLYAKPPDFKALASHDPEFASVVKGRDLDFGDPASVMQLTKTLLKLDFGIKIELPDDRLCPPVANRHNYVLLLKRLLDTSSYNPSQNAIVGLDIGTGASCIYPLLACTQRPWSFLATDIDEKSLGYARLNVKENGLEHRIKIVSRTPDQPMIPIDELESVNVDFVMTNPPFYSSADDLLKSAAQKAHPPHSACTGAEVEMVSPGGEVAFVTRLIEESLLLRNRIQWYTAMFGFLGSVSRIVESLRREGVDNMALMELVQGRTRRWVIGWSFGPMRPANDVARGIMSVSKSILPPKTKSTIIRLPQNGQVGAMADGLAGAVGRLDLLQWDWDKERLAGVGRAPDNVWNRAWRRKKSRTEGSLAEENNRGTFGFRISMHVAREDIEVTAEWLEGHDAAVFESFQGYLKTTMSSLSEPKQQ